MRPGITAQSEVCIIGRHGLIGSAIAKLFPEATSTPTEKTRILFHFGSYTHGEFEKNPRFHQARMFADLDFLLPFCKEHGIAFIYPSSALVYEEGNKFGLFKSAVEAVVNSYHIAAVGLRIFPVYGRDERRSVISQWCNAMRSGIPPVVYGDGGQSRDFVYIDDVVTQTMQLCDEVIKNPGHIIADVGTGKLTTFNDIIRSINSILGSDLKPVHREAPHGYRQEGVVCKEPREIEVPLWEGIHRILAAA